MVEVEDRIGRLVEAVSIRGFDGALGISIDFRPLGYDRAIMTGYTIGEGAIRFVYSNRQEEIMWLGSESTIKSIS